MASTTSLPSTFRAYQIDKYGDALEVIKLGTTQQLPLKPAEVCVHVHSAGLNPVDWKFVEFGSTFLPTSPSAEHPFRVGFDVSGTVVGIGAEVESLHVGDAVYGQAPFGGSGGFANYVGGCGTLAEFVNIDAKYLAVKPTKLSFTEAAGASITAQTSYNALVESAKLQPGERVLLAKIIGASAVIATTSSRNFELVKSLGADQAIDYTSEKWSDVIEAHSIDLICDCVAEPQAWNEGAQKVLKPNTGRYVTLQTGAQNPEPIESPIGATRLPDVATQPTSERMAALTSMFESGKRVVPIDSIHDFEKLQDALKVQKSNHARGKVVLKVLAED